jgi:hypothetical protein
VPPRPDTTTTQDSLAIAVFRRWRALLRQDAEQSACLFAWRQLTLKTLPRSLQARVSPQGIPESIRTLLPNAPSTLSVPESHHVLDGVLQVNRQASGRQGVQLQENTAEA